MSAGRYPPTHTATATAPKSVTSGNWTPMTGSSSHRSPTAATSAARATEKASAWRRTLNRIPTLDVFVPTS